jgi:MFS family permease
MEKEVMPPNRHAPLWRNRDYLLLWSGQTISSIGSGVSELAFPLVVLALTHSPAQAGFAGALRSLPYFIFTLPGGALVDRWDRKRVMVLCDAGRALSLASIPVALVLGHLTVVQLYLVSLIEGSLYVFFDLAETASLPRVVPKEQLPAAISQNQVAFGITNLLGPPLGGVLYTLGRAVPFLTDAVSYLASVLSLLFMRTKFQLEHVVAPRRLWTEMVEGVKWMWHQPLLRTMAFLNSGWSSLGFGFSLLVIVLAQRQQVSPPFIGVLFAIGGVTSILGAALAPLIQKRVRYGHAIIGLWWLYVLAWLLVVVAFTPFALGAIIAFFFLVDSIYNIVQFSYRLALIPDELQGRVNSAFRLISYSLRPAGIAVTGVLMQFIGVVPTAVVFAIILTLLALVASLNAPLRRALPLAQVQDE